MRIIRPGDRQPGMIGPDGRCLDCFGRVTSSGGCYACRASVVYMTEVVLVPCTLDGQREAAERRGAGEPTTPARRFVRGEVIRRAARKG